MMQRKRTVKRRFVKSVFKYNPSVSLRKKKGFPFEGKLREAVMRWTRKKRQLLRIPARRKAHIVPKEYRVARHIVPKESRAPKGQKRRSVDRTIYGCRRAIYG